MNVDQCSAAAAQFETGISCYSDDREAAVEWWRKAADQGHAEAQYLIGLCHHEKGTTVDKVSSVEWFRKAAAQGHAKAQHSIGCAYFYGDGVPVDRASAVAWFREAAERGHADAQDTIGGLVCADGDAAAAVEWFRKAADQGLAKAQYHIGCAHYLGHGVPVDHAAAVEWWYKAADQGHADAQGSIRLLCARTPVHRRDDKAKAKRVRKTKPNGRTGRNNAPPQGQEYSTDQ